MFWHELLSEWEAADYLECSLEEFREAAWNVPLT